MALELLDSSSHSGAFGAGIPVTRKWTQAFAASYANASGGSPAPVRRPGQTVIALVGDISKTLTYQSERFIGVAYYMPDSADAGSMIVFGTGGQQLVQLQMEADRSLSLSVSPSNTRIWNSGSSGLFITTGVYHYYEMSVTLSGATPISVTVSVNVDNSPWAVAVTGATGVNASSTLSGATAMNQVSLGVPTGNVTAFVCDIVVMNTSTTDVNGNTTTLTGFLGDVEVIPTFPVADVSVAWSPFPTGTPAGSTWTLIDENPPDDDTTYIDSDTVSQEATYNFTPLAGFTGTILGAQLLLYAKKDAEGARSITGVCAGTSLKNTYGQTQSQLNDYYDYYVFPLDTDLGTPWTESVFNAEAFGIDLTS